MRIDAHQHFWRYSDAEFGWINDEMAVMRRDFLPADLKPELDRFGFAGSIAVQARQSEEENQFLLDQSPLGVVGWVDLCAEDAGERLDFWRAFPAFRGVRHIVQGEPSGFLARADFRRGISLLADRGLTYDILIYHYQLEEAIAFARAFPNQPFVVDHGAKPDIRSGGFDKWAEDMREMAGMENVCCKISGLAFEADWSTWTTDTLRPYVYHLLECFGPRRLMIGSDWPVCLAAGSYERVMGSLIELLGELSPAEQEAILGDTAARFYGIAPEAR